MKTASPGRGVLTFSCEDRPGIVFKVANFLVDNDCTITESQQFSDVDAGRFFMRVSFAPVGAHELNFSLLQKAFEGLAREFEMSWRMVDAMAPTRVVLMVSKFAHCLNDLLFRTSIGELNLDVAAVVSNHPDLAAIADNYNVPFRHIPVTPDGKAAAEAELLQLVEREQVDLVVLARYMQILSDSLCRDLAGRAINIHHSMLPSFKGARPYHQAYSRGVKAIGATAHYVTADLDEGPIIEQHVLSVDHSMNADALVAQGRQAECLALARAVRWHAENRVMIHDGRTVVLR